MSLYSGKLLWKCCVVGIPALVKQLFGGSKVVREQQPVAPSAPSAAASSCASR